MPSSLLEILMAHERVEPWGDDWLQAATIASVSSATGYKKVIPVADLIPRIKQVDGMSDDQITNVLEAIRMAFS